MIAIVDFGMGNIRSVAKAFERFGAEVSVTGDAAELAAAEKLVLPGVGAFSDGIENIRKAGLEETLNEQVLHRKKPVLGICLGMQLFAHDSEEGKHAQGLGWIDAHVKRLAVNGMGLKVPHVGWNDAFPKEGARLFEKVSKEPAFYFVHSFAVECENESDVAAWCKYGTRFTASVEKGNIFGTQFHPEKSQKDGLRVIENFVDL